MVIEQMAKRMTLAMDRRQHSILVMMFDSSFESWESKGTS